jgi:hypothetical protein
MAIAFNGKLEKLHMRYADLNAEKVRLEEKIRYFQSRTGSGTELFRNDISHLQGKIPLIQREITMLAEQLRDRVYFI